PGLGTVPVYYAHPLVGGDHFAPRLMKLPQHRPLGRTQSAPLPQNPRSVQQQLYNQQQHQLLLERLKQQTHLGQLMLKRRAIQSEEGEGERRGPAARGGAGVSERTPPSRATGGPERAGEAKTEAGSTRHGVQEGNESGFRQQALLWDLPWIHQPHLLTPMEPLGVPYPGRCHRPLSRARSSPASASVPTPVPENPSKTSFTT
ncbi:histone deacetylase 4-like, partial [Mustelus asterias]